MADSVVLVTVRFIERLMEIIYSALLNTCTGLNTVKILKFGTPQTIAIIVLKIEKIGVTLH